MEILQLTAGIPLLFTALVLGRSLYYSAGVFALFETTLL